MLHALIFVGLLVLFVGLPLLCRWLAQWRPCQHCGGRLAPFKVLDESQSSEITAELARFAYPPEDEDVFACPFCRRVYQGLARSDSTTGDYRPSCRRCGGEAYLMGRRMETFPPESQHVRDLFKAERDDLRRSGIECFVCVRPVVREADCVVCNTPRKAWYCERCHTLHMWFQPEGCEFAYLTPLVRRETPD